MVRARGRPVTPFPIHPERVVSRAVQSGLSATVVLQRDITNKTTRKHYTSSQEIWNAARSVYQLTKKQGTLDYSYILKAEPQIRDNMLKILYEKAAEYGHTEVFRQKKGDDTVGPLNQRFNACGAALREFAHREFPLPNPLSFGTRTRRFGTERKKFRVAGYEKSSFGPRVILAHPDIPSMDFGDAVRSHNEYLATFCAIRNIPVRETTRYSNLFLLLARPYLEHIYSECKIGKSKFRDGVNEALRKVKHLIKTAGYAPVSYASQTVTGASEYEPSAVPDDFILKQVTEARNRYGNQPIFDEIGRIQQGGYFTSPNEQDEEPCLTSNDVEYIRRKALKRARITGSIMHRRISDLFPSPWNLHDVFFGIPSVETDSDYALISETSLTTSKGMGKIDLILLERIITSDGKQSLWVPRFIFEIKTRMGHSWYLEAERKFSQSRDHKKVEQRIVSRFPMNDCPLDDETWNSIIQSTPRPSSQEQLDIYAHALSENYQRITGHELSYISKGVLVIESISDIDMVRRTITDLVIKGYEATKKMKEEIVRTTITPNINDLGRIALVIPTQKSPVDNESLVTNVPWKPHYTPFRSKSDSLRRFILYLTGSSRTSAGESAAWHSRNYHGLQFLYEIREAEPNTKFIWIDLANHFNEPRLAEARLFLRPRGYSKEAMARAHSEKVREFFEGIEVRGYLESILATLYDDCDLPSFDFDLESQNPHVIVVTGADTLWNATSATHRGKLKVIFDELLNRFPENEYASIMWFDTPVPSIEKSVPYASRTLLPFYDGSSLAENTTDIIWNLPVAPRSAIQPEKWKLAIIGDSPMHDDIRVIHSHSPKSLTTELTHIPFLKGWSKRFRNKGIGLVGRDDDLENIVPEKKLRDRMKLLSFTLIPWLVQMWSDKSIFTECGSTLDELYSTQNYDFRNIPDPLQFTTTIQDAPVRKSPSIFELINLRIPETHDGTSFVQMTSKQINSPRLYRSPYKLQTKARAEEIKLELPQLLKHDDEVEQDCILGIKFVSEDDSLLPWWIVIQDPTNRARMLVGCFKNKPPTKDGFLWAETKHDILTQTSIDDIIGLSQIVMKCRKSAHGIETWSSSYDSGEMIESGVLEILSRGRSTVNHLRAIRQTYPIISRDEPILEAQPSESFYNQVTDSLRRYLEIVSMPAPVSVHLEMVDDGCAVTFIEEHEHIQTINVEFTAELIDLLRWPTIKGGPMFIESGKYVTWSIFDDIQYENLDFLRPYITFKAARNVPEELPKRIIQFFDEAETIPVSIEHDYTICPIAQGEGVDHDACWRVILPSDCPSHVIQQLGEPLTGEEVNGLLSSEKLYAKRLYKLEINLPSISEKDESVVFQEDRYIRMFLRNYGLFLKKLEPGTYLNINEQKWIIDIDWNEAAHIRWTAQSTVSGLIFGGTGHMVELSHGRGAEEECERILEVITSNIPREHIVEYSSLEEKILTNLKNVGYSKTSPTCELRIIEISGNTCRYGVYPVDRTLREPFLTLTIDVTGEMLADAIIEGVEIGISESELSVYSIRNKSVFLKKITTWVNKVTSNLDDIYEE